MGQEAYIIAENLIWWKQICLALLGFIVRFFWVNERPIPWMRVFSSVIFMMTALYFTDKWVSPMYQNETACLVGLFTNNIIKGLFRLWKVNEDGLIEKTRRWWNSDKK